MLQEAGILVSFFLLGSFRLVRIESINGFLLDFDRIFDIAVIFIILERLHELGHDLLGSGLSLAFLHILNFVRRLR